jgi:hypothetical protein
MASKETQKRSEEGWWETGDISIMSRYCAIAVPYGERGPRQVLLDHVRQGKTTQSDVGIAVPVASSPGARSSRAKSHIGMYLCAILGLHEKQREVKFLPHNVLDGWSRRCKDSFGVLSAHHESQKGSPAATAPLDSGNLVRHTPKITAASSHEGAIKGLGRWGLGAKRDDQTRKDARLLSRRSALSRVISQMRPVITSHRVS